MPYVVAWYADNVLKVSMAAPLALAVVGACIALFFSLDWTNGWENGAVFGFATLSGGAGGLIMYGLLWGLSRLIQLQPSPPPDYARHKQDSVPPIPNTPHGEE